MNKTFKYLFCLILSIGFLLMLSTGVLGIQSHSMPVTSSLDWSDSAKYGEYDYVTAKPKTGRVPGYFTIDNGDGTVSALVVKQPKQVYNWSTNSFYYVYPTEFHIEQYSSSGKVLFRKTLSLELPLFGTFFAGHKYNYVLFGQENPDCSDTAEVWRIVQYDKNWNRIASVSVNGGDSYTQIPFRSTVSHMTESKDGSSLVLHTSRKRYDGHQSNITLVLNTEPLAVETILGEAFPINHVSHSFGQFVRYDGTNIVTVDHGDAYPRSFVFQKLDDSLNHITEINLLSIYGSIGDNVTNAIGSGFEVSDSGYLFLGCSAPQDGTTGQPWNVFLSYIDRSSKSSSFTWLTDSSASINCARLVKISDTCFVAMWSQADGLHVRLLNGKGETMTPESILAGIPMPPTEPVVHGRTVLWLQTAPGTTKPHLYSFSVPLYHSVELQQDGITQTVYRELGDVNCDSNVNQDDITILSRYFAGWNGYIDQILSEKTADFDSNGKIERRDLMHLARYLNGWKTTDPYNR